MTREEEIRAGRACIVRSSLVVFVTMVTGAYIFIGREPKTYEPPEIEITCDAGIIFFEEIIFPFIEAHQALPDVDQFYEMKNNPASSLPEQVVAHLYYQQLDERGFVLACNKKLDPRPTSYTITIVDRATTHPIKPPYGYLNAAQYGYADSFSSATVNRIRSRAIVERVDY